MQSDAPTVQSWDIVVLKDLEGSKLSLARVLIAVSSSCKNISDALQILMYFPSFLIKYTILKFILRTQGDAIHTIELLEEESRGEFAATGIEQEINSTQIVTVITDFDYKQIQVDRAINPHGEHAEEIFTIPITSLPSEY